MSVRNADSVVWSKFICEDFGVERADLDDLRRLRSWPPKIGRIGRFERARRF